MVSGILAAYSTLPMEPACAFIRNTSMIVLQSIVYYVSTGSQLLCVCVCGCMCVYSSGPLKYGLRWDGYISQTLFAMVVYNLLSKETLIIVCSFIFIYLHNLMYLIPSAQCTMVKKVSHCSCFFFFSDLRDSQWQPSRDGLMIVACVASIVGLILTVMICISKYPRYLR